MRGIGQLFPRANIRDGAAPGSARRGLDEV